MLPAPVRSELAFDGGFEDGGLVPFEVSLDALEVFDSFVEAGELFFDLRDDALLFIEWWGFDTKGSDIFWTDCGVESPLYKARHRLNKVMCLHGIKQPSRFDTIDGSKDMEPRRSDSPFQIRRTIATAFKFGLVIETSTSPGCRRCLARLGAAVAERHFESTIRFSLLSILLISM